MPIESIHSNGYGGQTSSGEVSSRLLANNMDPMALRTNSTLMKDEWIQMDQTVKKVARERLVAVGDLMNAGLRFNVQNAMGTLVVQHHTAGEMTAAQVSMDGVTKAQNDRVVFDLKSTPLPIIHHDFQINARTLAASRRSGQTLDTTQVAEATRQVTEKIESLVFNGLATEDTLGFGGQDASLYGYTNFPQRVSASKTGEWDDSSVTGSDILADVLGMIQDAHDNLHFGPYTLYVPSNWFVTLLEDFKADSDKTIIQRLQEIPSISAIKPADKLANSNAVLVEMTSSNVDMVVGFEPMVVQWSSGDEMTSHYKVMAIMVLRPKEDSNGNIGLVHLS